MIHVEEQDTRFYIKESTIPGAGVGIFAKVDIKKNDFLRVVGVVIAENTVAALIMREIKPIKIYSFNNPQILGTLIPAGWGALVNHTDNEEKRNCEITPIGGDVYYIFTKDVNKDEEVLGNYGNDWCGWN